MLHDLARAPPKADRKRKHGASQWRCWRERTGSAIVLLYLLDDEATHAGLVAASGLAD